jgi:hypothetical protein
MLLKWAVGGSLALILMAAGTPAFLGNDVRHSFCLANGPVCREDEEIYQKVRPRIGNASMPAVQRVNR